MPRINHPLIFHTVVDFSMDLYSIKQKKLKYLYWHYLESYVVKPSLILVASIFTFSEFYLWPSAILSCFSFKVFDKYAVVLHIIRLCECKWHDESGEIPKNIQKIIPIFGSENIRQICTLTTVAKNIPISSSFRVSNVIDL